MTRRGLGAVLASAGIAICLLVLAYDPDAARARSSAAAIAPKEPGAPYAATAGAPEGSAVAATPAEPIRLAVNEQEQGPPPATPAGEDVAARTPADAPRPGMLRIESDQPLSITAEELEAIEEPDGSRRLVFNQKVNVDQGGLRVQSDRLEAHYAPQASEPERLVARGHVRVRQEKRELSCATATYFPAKQQLECSGNALLRDGANRVSGKTIEILFAEDRIRVKGGATVNVAPEEKKAAPGASAEARPVETTP